MMDGGEEPRPKAPSILAVAAGISPQGQKCLLHDLLRHERLPNHLVGESLGQRAVPLEQGAEGLLVADGWVDRHGWGAQNGETPLASSVIRSRHANGSSGSVEIP